MKTLAKFFGLSHEGLQDELNSKGAMIIALEAAGLIALMASVVGVLFVFDALQAAL